jgi:hypothetical protein
MIDTTWIPIILAFIISYPLGILCTSWINRLPNKILTGASIGFIASISTTLIFSIPPEPHNFYIFFCYGISALAMWTVLFLTSRNSLGLFTALGFTVVYPLVWKTGIFMSLEALPWQELLTYLSIFAFILGCLLRVIIPIFANLNNR